MVQRRITGYGVGSPKILLASPPVVAERNPATSDLNYSLGQIWLNRSTANVYILKAISAGSATWDPFAGASTESGTATLALGTVTVAHTGITAEDRIMVTRSDINGSTALGVFEVVKTPATNFVINARNPADATIQTNDESIVDYVITRQL